MAKVKTLLFFGLLMHSAMMLAVDGQTPSTPTPQTCSAQLANLETCAPFALPGAATPSSTCCSALSAVQHDCLCNTLQIVSRIPALCNVPALNCPAA